MICFFIVMTRYLDLDDMWNTPEAAALARQFYKKCIICLIQITLIYFIYQYLFIPKNLKFLQIEL